MSDHLRKLADDIDRLTVQVARNRTDLDVQFTRIAQLQSELDGIYSALHTVLERRRRVPIIGDISLGGGAR